MRSRVRCPALQPLVRNGEEAAGMVESGWTLGTTGTPSGGYPASFFRALAERASEGRVGDLELWSVAPLGDVVDGALARARALRRRLGMQANRDLTRAINGGVVAYADWGGHSFVRKAAMGVFGPLHMAVVEAAAIAEDGSLVPSLCVGDAPSLVAMAERVVVEVNHWLPAEIESLHDVVASSSDRVATLCHPGGRVGTATIPLDPRKVVAIVESFEEPMAPEPARANSVQRAIARNLAEFLGTEWERGRLSRTSVPVQVGLGGLGDAVLEALVDAGTVPVALHSPILGDLALRYLLEGQIPYASGTGLFLSRAGQELFFKNIEKVKERMVLRPIDVTGSPGVIGRLGCVSINTAVEIDLFGHVNSSHLLGGRLVSGVGGSIEFARNAALSIFLTPSVAKKGAISAVVPRVCHCDHTEHEVDVFVTEQGVADLRGTDPRERAEIILKHCAHPDYRPLLRAWLQSAGHLHEPQVEEGEHSFHARFQATGSMGQGHG